MLPHPSEVLYLDGNALTGTIPSEFGQLSNLGKFTPQQIAQPEIAHQYSGEATHGLSCVAKWIFA